MHIAHYTVATKEKNLSNQVVLRAASDAGPAPCDDPSGNGGVILKKRKLARLWQTVLGSQSQNLTSFCCFLPGLGICSWVFRAYFSRRFLKKSEKLRE